MRFGHPVAMVSIGYALSCEEFGPHELARLARLAEQAGFERLWISDHYHPWLRERARARSTDLTLSGQT